MPLGFFTGQAVVTLQTCTSHLPCWHMAGKTLKISACDFASFYVSLMFLLIFDLLLRCLFSSVVALCHWVYCDLAQSDELILKFLLNRPFFWKILGTFPPCHTLSCLILNIAFYERWINCSFPISFQFIFFLQMVIECLVYIKDSTTTRKHTKTF